MSELKKEVSTRQISAKELSELINDKRFKYEDIAEYYGINLSQARRAVKEAGLTMRRYKTAPFKIIHDLPETNEVAQNTVEENTNLTAKEESVDQTAPVENIETVVEKTEPEVKEEPVAEKEEVEEVKEEVKKEVEVAESPEVKEVPAPVESENPFSNPDVAQVSEVKEEEATDDEW